MKKSMMFNLLCGSAALAVLTGCQCFSKPKEAPVPPAVVSQAKFPIKFDGKLTDAAWSQTPGYAFSLCDPTAGQPPREAAVFAKDPFEGAVFKMLYDKEYLYVACTLEDLDIYNDYTKNQTMLLRGGDLFEFFIAPESNPCCYWEFYAAPNGLITSYFYPSRGFVGVNSTWDEDEKYLIPGFAAKVNVDGTLNNIKDNDKSWTVEMRIPIKELEEKSGMKFAPGSKWRVQAARYNYGHQLNRVQNSTYPALPQLSFHLVEYFSPVEFR